MTEQTALEDALLEDLITVPVLPDPVVFDDNRSVGDIFEEFQNNEAKRFSICERQKQESCLSPFASLKCSRLACYKSALKSPVLSVSSHVVCQSRQRRLRPNEKLRTHPQHLFSDATSTAVPSSSSIPLESLLCIEQEECPIFNPGFLEISTTDPLKQTEVETLEPHDFSELSLKSEHTCLSGVESDILNANIDNRIINLPSDILVFILSFLSAREVTQVVQFVCHDIRIIAQNDALWQIFFSRDFPDHNPTADNNRRVPWLSLYRRRLNIDLSEKYCNEPQHIRGLYIEMETALECLKQESETDGSKNISNLLSRSPALLLQMPNQSFIKNELQRWKLSHPDRPVRR